MSSFSNTKLLWLRQVSSNEFTDLEAIMKMAVKEKQQFVRLEMKKEDLMEMFKVSLVTCLVFIVLMIVSVV